MIDTQVTQGSVVDASGVTKSQGMERQAEGLPRDMRRSSLSLRLQALQALSRHVVRQTIGRLDFLSPLFPVSLYRLFLCPTLPSMTAATFPHSLSFLPFLGCETETLCTCFIRLFTPAPDALYSETV